MGFTICAVSTYRIQIITRIILSRPVYVAMQSVVVHHDTYTPRDHKAVLAAYEEAYRKFRDGQQMRPKTWSGSVVKAMTSMDYMGGRQNLRPFVEAAGYKLS
ncbi:nitroreductase family protein [Tardiphaga alba]|uniref:hypothetical protein n=1 Tax=Tardiphaga alba TaxID=340268 RepID=UPI001BABE61A|nr:hypothetical protein [Tardiphaga alba]